MGSEKWATCPEASQVLWCWSSESEPNLTNNEANAVVIQNTANNEINFNELFNNAQQNEEIIINQDSYGVLSDNSLTTLPNYTITKNETSANNTTQSVQKTKEKSLGSEILSWLGVGLLVVGAGAAAAVTSDYNNDDYDDYHHRHHKHDRHNPPPQPNKYHHNKYNI